MRDLYKILGVENNANVHAIRSAYKLKARTVHPDKAGGSTEAFQELNEAYSILRDQVKRAKYDNGESLEEVPDIVKIARMRLAELFSQAVDHAQDNKDMIKVIRASISTGALNFQKSIDQMNNSISKYDHVLTRVKYNGNDDGNLFAGTINQKIDNCNRTIKSLTKELELTKIVIELLNDYECSVEEPNHASYLPGGMNSQTSTHRYQL